MILVDLNQVIYKNYFGSVGRHTNVQADLPPMRNLVFNSLRVINKKFRREYGSMVLALDSRSNWRKNFFPHYKANRKKERDKSDVDWTGLYASLDTIKEEIIDNFPYHLIEIAGCEADDIIGTLVHTVDEKIVIVSGDKDFRQLQQAGVIQYDPIDNRYIEESNPAGYLRDHIISGDRSDGIPSIICDGDYFVSGASVVRLTAKRREALLGIENRENDKYHSNWKRNQTLIDLAMIPNELKAQIIDTYQQGPKIADRSKIMHYMFNHKLVNLVPHLNDF